MLLNIVLGNPGGFSLPLLGVLAFEVIWGLVLLLPAPLNAPGIQFAKLTRTKTGNTVIYTLSAVLMLLLVAPIYDVFRANKAAEVTADAALMGNAPAAALASTQAMNVDEGLQARTQLNFMLIAGSVGLLHFFRILGATLAECAQLGRENSQLKASMGEESEAKKESGVAPQADVTLQSGRKAVVEDVGEMRGGDVNVDAAGLKEE